MTPKSFRIPFTDRQFFKGQEGGWRTATNEKEPYPTNRYSPLLECISLAIFLVSLIWPRRK